MQPYRKRTDYHVDYEYVEPGTSVFNYLEDCEYEAEPGKDVKLIGTVGEEWIVSEEKLHSVYECENGCAYPKPDASIVWMRPAEGQEQVATSRGDILTANLPANSRGQEVLHGMGDMIACADAGGYPDGKDCWVVNGNVFANTYEPA